MPELSAKNIRLKNLATILAVAGAITSLAFMFYVGHRNPSILLMVMFTIWVASPYAGFVLINSLSNRLDSSRVALYRVIIFITAISLLIYGSVAFFIALRKPAAVFLICPLLSWVAMGITFLTSRSNAREN